jgi:hypothetical protein
MNDAVPRPVLTDRFAQFASVAHASQTRKGSAVPYLSHTMGVATPSVLTQNITQRHGCKLDGTAPL